MANDEVGGLTNSAPQNKEEASGDDVTNLKAEMNRKLANTEESLQTLQAQNKQLMDQLTAQQQALQATQAKPAAPKENVKLSELIYDNPDKAVEIIKQEAKEEALAIYQQQKQAEAQQSQVLSDIVKEYPEVSDANHALTKRAVEIYNKMSESDKQLPMSYRVAVMEAASEQSITPYSRRDKEDTDSFTLSGSSSGGKQRGAGKPENQDAMLKFAELMGIDTKDEKAVARLNNRNGRNYKRYR